MALATFQITFFIDFFRMTLVLCPRISSAALKSSLNALQAFQCFFPRSCISSSDFYPPDFKCGCVKFDPQEKSQKEQTLCRHHTIFYKKMHLTSLLHVQVSTSIPSHFGMLEDFLASASVLWRIFMIGKKILMHSVVEWVLWHFFLVLLSILFFWIARLLSVLRVAH